MRQTSFTRSIMFRTAIFCVFCATVLSTPCIAAPMAYYSGGIMTMVEVSPGEREAGFNYALSPRDAVGSRVTWMESQRAVASHAHSGKFLDGKPRHESAEINYTRLVQRWNTETAQLNVWAFGGIGAIRGNAISDEQFFYSPGLQFDAESTRFYFSLKGQLHRSKGVRSDVGLVRAGFSFWEADYEDTQPWLIVEAKRTREFSEKIEITPMLRLINKRFFAELGVTQDKKVKAGLMFVFDRM